MNNIFDAYAEYYDLLYADKDYTKEVDYVLSLLSARGVESGSILDLGCGTGRHAEKLAESGFRVVGIDLSSEMVAEANRRATSASHERLEFIEGNVRDVEICELFDAVIALFHVASYQTSNADIFAMFETAILHLKPGGVLVFDFWHGPAVLNELPSVKIKRMSSDTCKVLRVAEPELSILQNIVDVNYQVLVTDSQTQDVTVISEVHRMRYFFYVELQYILSQLGISDSEVFDWLGAEQPGLSSWAAVIVAKKPDVV